MYAQSIDHPSVECTVPPEGRCAALQWLHANRAAFARLLRPEGYRTQTTRRVAALCGLTHQWVLLTCTGELRSADGKKLLASFAELDPHPHNTVEERIPRGTPLHHAEEAAVAGASAFSGE